MDFTPFKLDIDELLDEYTEGNFTSFADMKRVWTAKKFSYIYEARPNSGSAVFMQSLFSQSISHMVSADALSRRLGGLYCLYCLYETQPYKPCFKVYLSLGELRSLKTLVVDAKENGIAVVPALVKRMLDNNIFLFGSVDISDNSVTERADDIMNLQKKRIQIAHEKLLANTRIQDYMHMDLGGEVELEALRRMSTEYAKAKEIAIKEVSPNVEVENIKSIAEKKKSVVDVLDDLAKEWDVQKEAFCEQTGVGPGYETVVADGFDELEQLLNE